MLDLFNRIVEFFKKFNLKASSASDSINNIFIWDVSRDSAKIRLLVVILGFILCFLTIVYRLIIVSNNEYVKSNHYQIKPNNFRKEIVDRNGNLLAINLPSASLFANPRKVVNPEESALKLIKLLPELNKTKLLSDLKSDKTFVWIKRDLSPKEETEVFNLGLPGFEFEHEQKRMYTFGNLLSHVIGYVGRDFVGLAGLEKKYDKFLTNKDIKSNKIEQEKPLELSIDVRLQNILSEELDKTISIFRPIGAVGIIADPHTGEVLAMVSKPDFDPHNPYKAKSEELFNRSTLGVYECGSGFKTITMAIGFDSKSITMNDAYDITYMKVGKWQIKDYHPRRGWNTVPEIFLHSSNIGTSQIMFEIGNDNLRKYLKNLGLLDQLQIELPERGTPLFPSGNKWSDITLVTMSYGYGLSISPAHFIQAALPAVNGGKFFPLTLIKQDKTNPLVFTRVFEENTSVELRKLMRLGVSKGNGHRAEVPQYLIGGKTGTAEKILGKRYLKNTNMSSFLGVLPASNPKYVLYIMIDAPKSTKESMGFSTAGWVAAPTAKRIFERMISLYGIEPIDQNSEEVQNLLNVQYEINGEV